MTGWHLETIPIKKLKSHKKNPRQISKEQSHHLENLIKKFGLIDKPIVNKDLTIIGGHQRINILKRLKHKEIECWVADDQLSDEDIDHLCIGLNLNQGTWNYDILANEWDAVDLLAYGFSEEQLLGIVKEAEEAAAALEDEDEGILEPGKDEDAITKMGDIYELGSHRLLCGDSTIPDDVAKCLNGAEPILMVTDPPYGVNYDPTWRNEVKGAHKPIRAAGKVQNDGQANWALTYSLFPGSICYVWHAGKYAESVSKDLTDAEYEIVSQIIWAKQHFALSRGDYHWQHEPCWYAVRKGHPHNWQGSRKESTLWEIANLNCFGKSKEEDERTAHSTQKPLECMGRPIRNNTAKGEGVYDPFLGSGTTLIAAENLERICYGIEISPAYCDIIVRRYVNLMAKKSSDVGVMKNGEKIDVLPYITAWTQ